MAQMRNTNSLNNILSIRCLGGNYWASESISGIWGSF